MRYAKEMGCSIKLLGIAKNTETGIEVKVHPTMIPENHPLAAVNDSFNAVFVHGDAVDDAMFYGRGAGALPTGSAVVGDIMDVARNMEAASSFIDVASILVEAKSAALLPGDEDGGRDERSMEALRERDLLFARLLQYRAFKQAADDFRARLAANSGRFPHPAVMDAGMSALLPELVWTLTPEDLARLAAQAFANAPASEVSVHQLHMPMVDLRAQSMLVRDRLRALPAGGSMTFAELTADAAGAIEVVARFLAVLAFFKQGVLQFKQAGPYETLHLR